MKKAKQSKEIRRMIEDMNPEATDKLKKLGLENGRKVSVVLKNDDDFDEPTQSKAIGEILIAGEDPENRPLFWFKGHFQEALQFAQDHLSEDEKSDYFKRKELLIPLYEIILIFQVTYSYKNPRLNLRQTLIKS